MPDSRRTILITGSTDGIGRQTAADLAAHPENFVIIHGRSEEKCLAAKEFIANECGGSRANLDFVVADLSVLSEVVELANEVERRFPSLNVLLCNAGVLNQRRLETKDGLEMMFQINYLSHFYLCHLLEPLLSRQQNSRILVIGSVLHSWTSIDWGDMMCEREYEKYLQYSRAKLMLHLFAFTLHRRMILAKKNVTVNVLELGKEKEPNNNGRLKSTCGGFSNSMSNLSLCRQASALTQIIENSSFNKMSGKYLDTCGRQLRSGQVATDERTQERLWDYTIELLASLGHTIVNHLANFILARKLLPLLAKNAPARIGLVSTICYEWHPLDFSDLEAKNKYDMYEQYSKTKLMNFMFGLKLSREAPGGVTVNICEPGVVDTKLLRQGPYSGGPVKDGAISSIKLVMDSELDEINGAYYDSTGKRVQKLSEDSTDQAQQDQIWQMSEEIAVKHGVKF